MSNLLHTKEFLGRDSWVLHKGAGAVLGLFALAVLWLAVFAFAGTAAAQSPDEHTFVADLSGDNEVPPVETDTAGDISVTFAEDGSSAEYDLNVSDGEDITMAHFHCAPEGENGPVIAFLFGPESEGVDVDGNLADGTLVDEDILEAGLECATPVTDIAGLEDAIEDGIIYANVHSIDHPAGVVRGQLAADDTEGEETATSTDDTVSIGIGKHICGDEVQSREDFDALGSFLDKLRECPTVILPGDEFTEYGEDNEHADFEFEVEGDDGEVQTLEDAEFTPFAGCEADIDEDINGDGEISDDVCIDASLYVFEGVASGDVTVRENSAPDGTHFGDLELVPPSIQENDDADALEDVGEEDDGTIVLATENDDGSIELRVFNFQDESGTGTSTDENDNDEADDENRNDVSDRVLESRIELLEDRIDRLLERLESRLERITDLLEDRQ